MRYLHTMVRVRDLEASLRFYCAGLGLKETRRMENAQGRYTLVFLAADETPEAERTQRGQVESGGTGDVAERVAPLVAVGRRVWKFADPDAVEHDHDDARRRHGRRRRARYTRTCVVRTHAAAASAVSARSPGVGNHRRLGSFLNQIN